MKRATNEIAEKNNDAAYDFLNRVDRFVQKCKQHINDDRYVKYLVQLHNELRLLSVDIPESSKLLTKHLNSVENEIQQLLNYHYSKNENIDMNATANIFINTDTNNIIMNESKITTNELKQLINEVLSEQWAEEAAHTKQLSECGSWAEAMQHPDFKHAIMKEVAPPGMETWVKANKERFKKQYGKKGTSVLYATAWKNFYKNKKHNEAADVKKK